MNRSKLNITSTFNAELLTQPLQFWLDKLNFPYQIQFAPYNQIFQQLLNNSSILFRNSLGINVILFRFEDWQQFNNIDKKDIQTSLHKITERLIRAINYLGANTNNPHLIISCPPSPNSNFSDYCIKFDDILQSAIEQVYNCYFIHSNNILMTYPVKNYYDKISDKHGHIPYTPPYFSSIATMIARKIYALHSPDYKVIVLDCDNTLWKGVCGEDGADGINLSKPYLELQQFMIEQYQKGMLLCLCSKNNESDVMAVFEKREDLLLKKEHLVTWQINWQLKSKNIKKIAEQLNLGLNNFIFIDDNPVECAEVRANCSEVLTLELPVDDQKILTFLKHVWAFDKLNVTPEDKERTRFYKQDVERKKMAENSSGLKQFLKEINLQIDLSLLNESHIPRFSQLSERTNQFNFYKKKITEADLMQFLFDTEKQCFVVHVKDIFGDYGLVGGILIHVSGKCLDVESFFLSCRALGKGVEHKMMAMLGAFAIEKNIGQIHVDFKLTDRNEPALNFLETLKRIDISKSNGKIIYIFEPEILKKINFE